MATRRFKVVAGSHVALDGSVYKEGEVVESERDLAEAFVNKFVEVHESAEELSDPDIGKESLGEDVSDKFSEFEAGVRVFKKNGKFTVYDLEDPNNPVNDKPLTKKAVIELLSELAGESD